MAEIVERIRKDIRLFNESARTLDGLELDKIEKDIVELAKMYASDSEAWLKKGDHYTSFSSIAYAHGLLDAVLKMKGVYRYGLHK